MSERRVDPLLGPVKLHYTIHAGDVTGTFLEALLEGRLEGRRCPDCHKVYVPPRSICPTCAARCTETVTVGPNGTVTTFSIVRFPYEGQRLEPPYACAHILLDGADVPLLHIVGGCSVDVLRMGLRVTPVWSEVPEPSLASVRYYRPSDEPDATYASFQEHV